MLFASGLTLIYTEIMEFLKRKPVGLWGIGGTWQKDYSGLNSDAVITGTIPYLPLTNYSQVSRLLNTSTDMIAFSTNGVLSGSSENSFTLAATVYKQYKGDTAQEVQVLGATSGDAQHGLFIDGDVVKFMTTDSNGVASVAQGFASVNKKMDIVGIHTASKNYLYVDGELAGQDDCDRIDYEFTVNTLYSKMNGIDGFAIDTVGIFNKALTFSDITNMYQSNAARPNINAPASFDPFMIPLTRAAGIQFVWETRQQFNLGTLTNLTWDGNYVVGKTSDDATVEGVWEHSVSFNAFDPDDLIYGGDLYYIGKNIIVEVSPDGNTWTEVHNGEPLSIFPSGTSPAGKGLSIRVTFPEGQSSTALQYMKLSMYSSLTDTQGVVTKTYGTNSATMNNYAPLELRDDNGVSLVGERLVVSTPASDPQINSIELWVKTKDTNTDIRLIDTRPVGSLYLQYNQSAGDASSTSGGTLYVNGSAATATNYIIDDVWNIVHVVLDTPITAAASISFNGHNSLTQYSGESTISRIVYYEKSLTATDVLNIVRNYTGYTGARYTDTASISLSESTISIKINKNYWQSIQ